ncbi:uncharacterized protein LOC128956553 [Oppia nitens]|uniref:uncharacterized protein LOC128956553 n=1 Tax=Oppia nitens TaxID=1686743 RepID=UPI0023DCA084|nr:uncharacterized protein LOC128956553 [Oppia nitens]
MDRHRKGVGKFIQLLAKNNTIDFNECREQHNCFIDDLPDDLWPLVDGIVDYGFLVKNMLNNRSGYILFFNIDGKPYYCSTPLNQTLSPKCKSKDSLKPYAINCKNIWPEEITTTTTTSLATISDITVIQTNATAIDTSKTTAKTTDTSKTTAQTTDSTNKNGLMTYIIVAVIVIIIVVVIVIVICLIIFYTKKSNEDKNKPETNMDAVATIRSLDGHNFQQQQQEVERSK